GWAPQRKNELIPLSRRVPTLPVRQRSSLTIGLEAESVRARMGTQDALHHSATDAISKKGDQKRGRRHFPFEFGETGNASGREQSSGSTTWRDRKCLRPLFWSATS